MTRLSSDSSAPTEAEAATPIKQNDPYTKMTEADKVVIEEMRACASDLEDLEFDGDDDEEDSVCGHRGRRNTDSRYVNNGCVRRVQLTIWHLPLAQSDQKWRFFAKKCYKFWLFSRQFAKVLGYFSPNC